MMIIKSLNLFSGRGIENPMFAMNMNLCGFKKGVTTNQMEQEKALAVSLQLYA